jgi:hypothetical protein
LTRLLDFYLGNSPDSEGRFLKDLWAWSDDELEYVHDFIQWLFPLPEPSRFNPHAPLLTPEDIAAFNRDECLRQNLAKSFERILSFLGLELTAAKTVIPAPNHTTRAADVWSYPNHNWLRISRILRSLHLLGLDERARAFYACLNDFYTSRKYPISAETFRYWTSGVGPPQPYPSPPSN